jgi:hypothetical protein
LSPSVGSWQLQVEMTSLFAAGGRAGTMNAMSLAHLLKHIKALPARERKRLLREILVLDEPLLAARLARKSAAKVTWPDVEVRGKRITGDRVMPNLVLLDRGGETS